MNEQQEKDLKNFKTLIKLFFGLMFIIVLVGVVAGVVAMASLEGEQARRSDLIIPVFLPMIIAAVAGAIPIRILKKRMFPTKEAFEEAGKLFREKTAPKS